MKRKSLFNKVGFLALILALVAGTTGVVYGMWAQTVNVNVSSNTGSLTWNLTLGTPTATGGSISDYSVIGNVISITINNSGTNTYIAPFDIMNTGTIPIKIQSITILQSITIPPLPPGVTATASLLLKGDQLDPGITKHGQISITDTVTGPITINITILPVQWNQYVP